MMTFPALNPTVLLWPPRSYWELSSREVQNSSLLHVEQSQQLLCKLLPVILSDV